MTVNFLERVEQTHPAFAVEAADRAAKTVDRLLQFVAVGGAQRAIRLELGKLSFGDEVDWAQPLALGGQALEGPALGFGRREFGRIEGEALRQKRWRAFKLLAAFPRKLGAARLIAAE